MAQGGKTRRGAEAPTRAAERALRRRARHLLKETRRLVRKRRGRLEPEVSAAILADAQSLRVAIETGGDITNVDALAQQLDTRLEDHLGRYRKSVTREYVESILWAVAIALFIRAFFFEAFQIPTGSMIPTLRIGDHIFVNKFIYGIRIPWTHVRFFEWRTPERGEIIVFEYPGPGPEHGKDFIKRVVAVAGDRVRLRDYRLFINGEPLFTVPVAAARAADIERDMSPVLHSLRSSVLPSSWGPFPCSDDGMKVCECVVQFEQTGRYGYISQHYAPPCQGTDDWPLATLECGSLIREECPLIGARPNNPTWPDFTIPEGFVFCMGDNRDNSSDGRFWGLVPLENVKGKAFVIWYASDLSRIFSLVH